MEMFLFRSAYTLQLHETFEDSHLDPLNDLAYEVNMVIFGPGAYSKPYETSKM